MTKTEESLLPIILPELLDNEVVLWAERPISSHFIKPTIPLMVFGLVFASFSGTMLVYLLTRKITKWVTEEGEPTAPLRGFLIIPTVFFLIGLGMSSAPLWERWRALKTVYVMTDKRILIIRSARDIEVEYIYPDGVDFFQNRIDFKGSGDLTVSREPSKNSDGEGEYQDVKLVGISDVQKVNELFRKTFGKSTTDA